MKRLAALAVSLALVATAPGIEPYRAFAQTRGGSVVTPVPAAGLPATPAAAVPLIPRDGPGGPPLSLPAAAPLSPLPSAAPTLGPAAASARPSPSSEARPAAMAAALALPAPSPAGLAEAGAGAMAPASSPGAAARPSASGAPALGPAASAVARRAEAAGGRAPGLLRLLAAKLARPHEAPPSEEELLRPPSNASDAALRHWSDASFSSLKGDDAALPASARAEASPALLQAEPAAARSDLRRPPAARMKTAIRAGLWAIAAAPLAAVPQLQGGDLGGALGSLGYLLGNALAFAFPIPQIYKTLREGHADGFPILRASLGAAASALLGLVNATVLDKSLWGTQNLFGAMALLAPPLLAAWTLRRGGKGLAPRRAAAGAAAASAAILGGAALLYAGAAAVVPAALGSLLGPSLPSLTLAILIGTGAVYSFLFIPDTVRVIRGRPPAGFTSLFSFLFFLDSALFLAWTSVSAVAAAPGPLRTQYFLFAGLNALSTAASFLSFWFMRRRERIAPLAARAEAAPTLPAAAARPTHGRRDAALREAAPRVAPLVEVLGSVAAASVLLSGLFGMAPSAREAGQFAAQARAVFLRPPLSPRARSLTAILEETRARSAVLAERLERQARRLDGVSEPRAVRAEAESLADKLRSTPFDHDELLARAGALLRGERGASPAGRSLARTVDQIAALHRRAKALRDLSRLSAEGVVRTRIYAASPQELRRSQLEAGWDRSPEGEPIADAVVIGAGPAGLSTALHAAHEGLRVVVFEAGYLAQSFSDAAMKPVYRMRTPATRNSLAQEPFSPAALARALSMQSHLRAYRELGRTADERLFRSRRMLPSRRARAGLGPDAADVPSTRNELLQHFAHAAEAIAASGSHVVEQAPALAPRRRADGLWEVRTSAGHLQLARRLVLAQGQVGADGQHGLFASRLERAVQGFPGEFIALKDRRDLPAKNRELHAMIEGLRGRRRAARMIVHDSLLGEPQVEESVALLPPGTRVAVLGSGESAVKAVMAVLRINPGSRVDLYLKGPPSAGQLQIPKEHAAPEFIDRAFGDAGLRRLSIEQWREFGVPVTPDTLADLEEQRRRGRLRIIPLGKKFVPAAVDDDSPEATVLVSVQRGPAGPILRLLTKDPEVRETLLRQGVGREDASSGAYLISEIDGPVISAIGYDRQALRSDPVTRALEEGGSLRRRASGGRYVEGEFEVDASGLASASDETVYVVGAQNIAFSTDSAIPGAVARAARVAQRLKRELRPDEPEGGTPGRRVP